MQSETINTDNYVSYSLLLYRDTFTIPCMNRVTLFIILVFICSVNAYADNIHHNVHGRVADNITGEPIPAKVFLMNADSTVIASIDATVDDVPYQGQIATYEFKDINLRKGKYIVKASVLGYKDAYENITLQSQRQSVIMVKPILMEHDFHELQEVTVKATKIKMVMRGDTIVYNADAFNLAEGSMLDALVARLPGAQLTRDGQIFVNGRLVKSLLVNGRDFFSGNPKMALENLPSYTVSRIKVYDREGQNSRLMQRDMGDKSLVMDVKLKKEYNSTFFGNIEAGMGTNGRFALKGFGMKSSRKEMLFAFANINNLSDNQKADMTGRWTPQDTPNGLLTNRSASFSYARFFDSNMDKWLTTQNTISHNDGELQTRKNIETILPGNNFIRQSQSGTESKITIFDSQNALRYSESGKYSTMTNVNFRYKRNNKYANALSACYDSKAILNELIERDMDKSENYNLKLTNNSSLKYITDMLHSDFDMEYDKLHGSSFSLYDLKYVDASQTRDFRNRYLANDSRHWDVKEGVAYDWNWPGWSLRPQYQYEYKYNKTNNALYRLDKLENYDSTRYDLLPSSRAALMKVLDANNSYYYTEYQNHHRLMLEWEINGATGHNKMNIEYGYIRFPLRLVSKNLYYTRMGRHDVSEREVFFEPEAFFTGGNSVRWELSADIKSEIPDLVKKVDYLDDSDPLYLISGNPELKNIHRYQASFLLRHEGNGQRMWNASVKYGKTDNDIAYATLYDMRTGVSTIKPVSVNGNWRMEGQTGFTLPLDSARRWTLDSSLSVRYNHNVDMTNTEENASSLRSIVNNWQMGDEVKLNFRPNDRIEFALHASGTYYYINSQRSDLKNIHAGDYQVGLTTDLQFPWSIAFGSDITLYARRGYYDSMMNTTDWVWNAHLSRSFMKGALVAKLTGFDLLHQLSSTRYEMNAQGRTEVWYNSLPRYIMLSLAWKFNVSPKRK